VQLLELPPYSSDLNPIERMVKVQAVSVSAKKRSREDRVKLFPIGFGTVDMEYGYFHIILSISRYFRVPKLARPV
jgi:transposase